MKWRTPDGWVAQVNGNFHFHGHVAQELETMFARATIVLEYTKEEWMRILPLILTTMLKKEEGI